MAGWESVAEAWEQNRQRVFDAFASSSTWLVDHVEVGTGAAVLELAAGPGETGFAVAERLGPTGTVISTDLSPSMVEAARRGAAARGLANVRCRVMDAMDLDLGDASVDGVLCRLGLMLVPDPDRVCTEVRRVLRPGGRFAYTAIGAPDRNPWLGVLVGALLEHGHAPGDDPFAAGAPFSLSNPDRNVEMLTRAGFTDARVEPVDGVFRYADAADYWDTQLALTEPLRAVIGSLDVGQRAAVRSTCERLLEPFGDEAGLALPTQVVAVVAASPSPAPG